MLLAVLYVSVATVASIGQSDRSAEQSQRLLEGSWEAHMTASVSILMEIDGDQIKLFTVRDGQKSHSWNGKLAVSKSDPERHLDWKDRVSINGNLPDNQCLYRLLGDTLLIIGGGPDSRPDQFLSGHGNEPKTMIFTRVEEGGKQSRNRR